MNFLNFRSLTKQEVPEKYVLSILEDSWSSQDVLSCEVCWITEAKFKKAIMGCTMTWQNYNREFPLWELVWDRVNEWIVDVICSIIVNKCNFCFTKRKRYFQKKKCILSFFLWWQIASQRFQKCWFFSIFWKKYLNHLIYAEYA